MNKYLCFAIPDLAEGVAVSPPINMFSLWPPISYYSVPIEGCDKAMVALAIHYFESGAVHSIHRRFPLELVPSG
jgi:hypothetical protein